MRYFMLPLQAAPWRQVESRREKFDLCQEYYSWRKKCVLNSQVWKTGILKIFLDFVRLVMYQPGTFLSNFVTVCPFEDFFQNPGIFPAKRIVPFAWLAERERTTHSIPQ